MIQFDKKKSDGLKPPSSYLDKMMFFFSKLHYCSGAKIGFKWVSLVTSPVLSSKFRTLDQADRFKLVCNMRCSILGGNYLNIICICIYDV